MHKPHNLTRQSHRFKYKQPHKSIAARNPPLPQPSCLAQSPNKATNQAQPPSTPQPVPTQNSNIPTSKIQPTSQQAQEYSAAGLQSPDNQAPQGTPPAKPSEGNPPCTRYKRNLSSQRAQLSSSSTQSSRTIPTTCRYPGAYYCYKPQ